MRAIITTPCYSDAIVFDPSTNVLYVTCVQSNSKGEQHYHIRKKTFNDTVDEVIYNAPQGKKQRYIYVVVEV